MTEYGDGLTQPAGRLKDSITTVLSSLQCLSNHLDSGMSISATFDF